MAFAAFKIKLVTTCWRRSSFPHTWNAVAGSSATQNNMGQPQLIRHEIHGLPHDVNEIEPSKAGRLCPRGGRTGGDSQ